MMQAFPSENRTARLQSGEVVALRPLGAMTSCRKAWRALSRATLVDNLFYEPDFALAGAETFGAGIGILMVCDGVPEQGARMLAAWPCRIVHRWGVPLPAMMGWTHGFSIFGAPLVDAEQPEAALAALLDAPRHLRLPRRLILPYLPLDGPLADAFERVRRHRASRRVDFWTHERGFLDVSRASAEERAGYLAETLSRGKARQLDRFARRLAAGGAIRFETYREGPSLLAALDDYVALEARGWKGRLGTAIAQRPGEAAFLRGVLAAYAARGEARIDRLIRDTGSIAVSIALRTGRSFWYLKIAHDEDEARNSPGAQLIRAVTESILADPAIATADSCAPPDLSVIEAFWGERRRLAYALVEAGGGDPFFRVAVGLERLRALAGRLRTRAGRA